MNPYGNPKHGMRRHPLYDIWNGMIGRTTNPNHPKYEIYGDAGRGVCDEWLDVRTFIHYVEQTLGARPTPQHTIDRVRNDLGYEPGNIRWATKTEQKTNSAPMSEATKQKISESTKIRWSR